MKLELRSVPAVPAPRTLREEGDESPIFVVTGLATALSEDRGAVLMRLRLVINEEAWLVLSPSAAEQLPEHLDGTLSDYGEAIATPARTD